MKQLNTSKMTAQRYNYVQYVRGSDGVVISPKLDSMTVISRG